MDVNQSKTAWLRILEWPLRAVSEFRANAPAPQFTSQDQYRITKALCALNAGAESCDPQKNSYANSLLALFRDISPVPYIKNSIASNQTEVDFTWSGSDYRLLCGAGMCTLQKQIRVEKSEWEQFLTGSLLTGCAPSPQEIRSEDVGSFKELDVVIDSTSAMIDQANLSKDEISNKMVEAIQVAAGASHTCALLKQGAVMCWGDNVIVPTPVDLIYTGKPIIQIAVGSGYACALSSDGLVQCWGDNWAGQLGDGTDKDSSSPILVKGLGSAVQISAGSSGHACALLKDGAIQCWGRNDHGQLGNGIVDPIGNTLPVFVENHILKNDPAIQVVAGALHTCALMKSGIVECWGMNNIALVGTPIGKDVVKPTVIVGINTVNKPIQITTGNSHACALLEGGAIQCWGGNVYTSLGDGTGNHSFTAVYVKGIEASNPAVGIAAGDGHTCAVLNDGAIKCWGGAGLYWQQEKLDIVITTPMVINGITDSKQIAAGALHTCSLLQGGNILCWGGNSSGQLGVGAKSNKITTPTEVKF